MKRVFLLLGIIIPSMMMIGCNSIDSAINDYEKACKSKDLEKISKATEKLGTFNKADFTVEQINKLQLVTMDCITSSFGDAFNSLSNSAKEEIDQVSSSASSTNWDALLDEYEELADKYISYVKKAVKGDASALEKCNSLYEKAEDFVEKLDSAKDDMSAAQANRLTKIQKKLADAVQEINKATSEIPDASEIMSGLGL